MNLTNICSLLALFFPGISGFRFVAEQIGVGTLDDHPDLVKVFEVQAIGKFVNYGLAYRIENIPRFAVEDNAVWKSAVRCTLRGSYHCDSLNQHTCTIGNGAGCIVEDILTPQKMFVSEIGNGTFVATYPESQFSYTLRSTVIMSQINKFPSSGAILLEMYHEDRLELGSVVIKGKRKEHNFVPLIRDIEQISMKSHEAPMPMRRKVSRARVGEFLAAFLLVVFLIGCVLRFLGWADGKNRVHPA